MIEYFWIITDFLYPPHFSNTTSDMDEGAIASMKTLGVTESYKLKRQVVLSASEAAEMIIRCVAFLAVAFVVVFSLSVGWIIL